MNKNDIRKEIMEKLMKQWQYEKNNDKIKKNNGNTNKTMTK